MTRGDFVLLVLKFLGAWILIAFVIVLLWSYALGHFRRGPGWDEPWGDDGAS